MLEYERGAVLVAIMTLTSAGLMSGCQRPVFDWLVDDSEPVSLVDRTEETPLPQPVSAASNLSPPVVSDPSPVQLNTYTVRRGDTLWSIATRTYGDGKRWQDILSANDGLDPTQLTVGQKIILP